MADVETPEEWRALSDRDLRMAALAVEGGEYWDAFFHCQQAIEKRLKMVFVLQNRGPHPRIHNLIALAELVGYKMGDGERREMLDLTRRYVGDRYPVEEGAEKVPEDAEDALQCLELTKAVCQALDDMASRRT